jgi:hypothetical protein
MVLNSRINSWESWFIFNLQKNKQSVEAKIQSIASNEWSQIHNQAQIIIVQETHNILGFLFFLHNLHHHILCTYLSGYFLGIPRKYIHLGLVLGLDWTSCRLSSTCILLFGLVHPVSFCLSQRFMFHTCTLPWQLTGLTLVHKKIICSCYI